MAEAAITSLLEKLEEAEKWHDKLISGSENDLKGLSSDLRLLKAFFKDATKKMTDLSRLTEMETQIKEVILDIEDAMDRCLLHAEARSMMSAFRRRLNLSRFSVAKTVGDLRIQKLNPMFDKVQTDFLALHIPNSSFPAASFTEEQVFRIEKSKYKWQEKFVGFKDEASALISKLMEETNEVGVIAICGIDGLGKTTLATKIFEDEQICLEFVNRIWIPSGSERFNRREVFLNILQRFIGECDDLSDSGEDELARAVGLCLSEEKFLLVFDDLRSSDDWRAVKNALPPRMGHALGKVLITTHNLTLAKFAMGAGAPHMLRSLSNEESWELLQLEVLGNLKDCSPELIKACVGEKIAGVCYGLTLAVGVIGGILVDMFTKTGPTPVLKHQCEIMYAITKENYRSHVIELSYDRLSGYLKECFLYLAVFPEDHHTIPARKLMRLWIGEGFIPPMEGRTLEETAEDCLEELISRNLLTVAGVNPIGQVKTCRVHNVIREFARNKALEQDLFQEIDTPNQRVLREDSIINRLCLHSELSEFLSENSKGTRARSLLCFQREQAHLDPKRVSTISDVCNLLRVLDAKYVEFTQFPAWLTKLIHLRCVTLNVGAVTVVPEAISQLWNLETLVVETESRSITMKANIWRMYRLRHLQTKAAIVLDTKREGKAGEKLQTVSRLSPESFKDISERASNLKTLAIRGKLAIIFENMSSLQNMEKLEKLGLVNDDPSEMAPLQGLPPCTHFPRTLKRLTLSNTFLKWKHMSTLAEIKTLEVLKLKDHVFTGVYWNAEMERFPMLQFLLITNTDLVHWVASASSFPKLNCLVIKMCENLNEIPEVLSQKLTNLNIERVGKSALQSARKIAKLKASSGFKLSVGTKEEEGCCKSEVEDDDQEELKPELLRETAASGETG